MNTAAKTLTAEEARREDIRRLEERRRTARGLAEIPDELWQVLRDIFRAEYQQWLDQITAAYPPTGGRDWWAGFGRCLMGFQDNLHALRKEGQEEAKARAVGEIGKGT
jgi:hypothetical protein